MTRVNANELKQLLLIDPIGTTHENAKMISEKAIPKQKTAEYKKAIDIISRKREWEDLYPRVGIEVVNINTFPENRPGPILILYCADHCLFCYLIKPTFARLARFFGGAKIYYSDDERLLKREGVTFTPCLMAYLSSGKRAGMFTGNTTRMLWDLMNLLPVLAENPTNENDDIGGTCTNGMCIVR